MTLAPEHRKDFEALPPVLRELLEAELAAGNTITEVSHSHPAPPVGACFMLARRVTTRPHASGDGLFFRERNSSLLSGEFTDAKRFFFVLEPPLPPAPEPDMNAIRAAMEVRQREADRARAEAIEAERRRSADLLAKFQASMELNYERWKEGTSYDLDLLKGADREDRAAIEQLLVTRGVRDWRDVEALAALDSPRARSILCDTLAHGSREHAVAVLHYAPQLVTEAERTATLVAALGETTFYAGLTQTLLEVQAHHPPAVIDALLRGVLGRGGGEAVHFAAMLLFLHGQANAAFDWDQRPYFLKFNTPDRAQRETMFRDLCARIGVTPETYLAPG